jgi:hypothetical protein
MARKHPAEQWAEHRRQCEEEERRQRVTVITVRRRRSRSDAARPCRRDPEVSPGPEAAGAGDRLGGRRPPAEFGVIGAFADPKGQLRPPSPTTG